MDEFSFFFTFYGLLLGLAAAEVLSGLGSYVRARPLRTLDPLAALLVLLVFLVICATWLDAWSSRADFSLSLASLWAPIGAATSYYLVATVVMPRDPAAFDSVSDYVLQRKGFIAATMIVAEVFVKVMALPIMLAALTTRPAVFWLWHIPYNFIIFAGWGWLWAVRGRRDAMAAAAALIAIYSIPYWESGSFTAMIGRAWGY